MICQSCVERADRRPDAPGCGEDCGINGCTCQHKGQSTSPRSITHGEFATLLRDELLGLHISTPELGQAVERLRARYCYGRVLRLILPDHDHPHVLIDVDLLMTNDPFAIEVATKVDPCPVENSSWDY